MPISLSQEIPEVFNPQDPESMRQWMVAVKQCIEELSHKGKAIQETTRSTVPTTADVAEKEDVDYVSGATIRRYTKIDGAIRYVTET